MLILEEQRCGAHFECFDDVIGNGVQQGESHCPTQQPLAERVKPFDLVAALLALSSPLADARRKLAGDEG